MHELPPSVISTRYLLLLLSYIPLVLNPSQVLSWDQLELKDNVQVKDGDSNLYSSAIIVGLHSNNTYDVVYEVSLFSGDRIGLSTF